MNRWAEFLEQEGWLGGDESDLDGSSDSRFNGAGLLNIRC